MREVPGSHVSVSLVLEQKLELVILGFLEQPIGQECWGKMQLPAQYDFQRP